MTARVYVNLPEGNTGIMPSNCVIPGRTVTILLVGPFFWESIPSGTKKHFFWPKKVAGMVAVYHMIIMFPHYNPWRLLFEGYIMVFLVHVYTQCLAQPYWTPTKIWVFNMFFSWHLGFEAWFVSLRWEMCLLRNHTCRIVLYFCLAPIRNSQQAVEVNWTSEIKVACPWRWVEFVHFDRSCIVQREHIYCGSTVPFCVFFLAWRTETQRSWRRFKPETRIVNKHDGT